MGGLCSPPGDFDIPKEVTLPALLVFGGFEMRKIGSAIVVLLGVAFAFSSFNSEVAVAQDFKSKPNFGEKKLETGFEPDPFKKKIVSGGDKVVPVDGVKMKTTEGPDFRLIYKAGDTLPLSFYVSSETD